MSEIESSADPTATGAPVTSAAAPGPDRSGLPYREVGLGGSCDTRMMLRDACEQAHARGLDDVLAVDVDAHHCQAEASAETWDLPLPTDLVSRHFVIERRQALQPAGTAPDTPKLTTNE